MIMKYEMKDLVPIVAKLVEGYTSKQSTSVSYEKAQQLMSAVLYCIQEAESGNSFAMTQKEGLSAYEMYQLGLSCVEAKIRETLAIYNELMTFFVSYENICLKDTVTKGLPEFFKWYDCKYEPQNTILTLDYPILSDLSQYTGIDRIYEYVLCIQSEQKFLGRFPQGYVVKILSRYNRSFRQMIDNICEIVLMNVLLHLLAGKTLDVVDFEKEEWEQLQIMLQEIELETLRSRLKRVIVEMVSCYYGNDEHLKQYILGAVEDIAVRIRNAAEYGNLKKIFSYIDIGKNT